eukprot:GGOE01014004.1.p1 GENE.GGOE01014004.1~~GGOE01014004.1.p1  ORF type:complete len:273 (-),score=57.82 GGOE01014004.1:125-943(-)
MEVPLELLGIIAFIPASGMLMTMLFGNCFLTQPLYGEDECQRSRGQGRTAVVVVCCLCLWQYATYVGYIWPVAERYSPATGAIYHCLLGTWAYCYLMAARAECTVPPGAVGDECKKCSRPRPNRTHHCRQCGVCVLDQDHHCLFVNNCVGHHNRKYFVLLVLYAAFIALLLLVEGWPLFRECLTTYGWQWYQYNLVIGYFATMIIFPLTGVVFAIQALTVPLGMTTIDLFAWLPCTRKKGKEYTPPLITPTLMWRNTCLVMGPNPLQWLIPC